MDNNNPTEVEPGSLEVGLPDKCFYKSLSNFINEVFQPSTL